VKILRLSIILLFIWASGCLQGCIDVDELDFPDDRSDEIVQTLDVFTLLNYYLGSDRPNTCFSIVFPFELAYNTGIIISIEDLDGLSEAIENQSSTFYIEGVILPVLVNRNGVLSSIETDTDLKELLTNCEIPRLADYLSDFKSQCFELVFPITIVNNRDTIEVENNDVYHDLKSSLGNDFAPDLQFPLEIEIFRTDELVTVTNYYQLLQLINQCVPCPEGSILINPEYDGRYTFKAIYDRIDAPISYKWYINEDFIREGATSKDDSLVIELPEGEFEICLQSFNADCNAGTFSCRTLTVERPCPVLFFEKEQSSTNALVYHFYANFELQNEISFGWVVYKNNEFLFFEEEFPGEGDGKFTFEFTAGSYKVCLEKENVNQNCQLAQYCTEIFIQ